MSFTMPFFSIYGFLNLYTYTIIPYLQNIVKVIIIY